MKRLITLEDGVICKTDATEKHLNAIHMIVKFFRELLIAVRDEIEKEGGDPKQMAIDVCERFNLSPDAF